LSGNIRSGKKGAGKIFFFDRIHIDDSHVHLLEIKRY
jgi:hypothetical protein